MPRVPSDGNNTWIQEMRRRHELIDSERGCVVWDPSASAAAETLLPMMCDWLCARQPTRYVRAPDGGVTVPSLDGWSTGPLDQLKGIDAMKICAKLVQEELCLVREETLEDLVVVVRGRRGRGRRPGRRHHALVRLRRARRRGRRDGEVRGVTNSLPPIPKYPNHHPNTDRSSPNNQAHVRSRRRVLLLRSPETASQDPRGGTRAGAGVRTQDARRGGARLHQTENRTNRCGAQTGFCKIQAKSCQPTSSGTRPTWRSAASLIAPRPRRRARRRRVSIRTPPRSGTSDTPVTWTRFASCRVRRRRLDRACT